MRFNFLKIKLSVVLKKSITIIILFLLCANSNAQKSNMKTSTVSLHFDQDFLVRRFNFNQDRNYTMGFGASYSNKNFGKLSFLFKPVKELGKLHLNSNHLLFSSYIDAMFNDDTDFLIFPSTISIGGNAFTPDDLTVSTPILGDRPYSSILYLGTKSRYLNPENNTFYVFELNIGFLGLNVAKEVQTEVHSWSSLSNSPQPKGWNNQISNGGEITALYAYKVEKLITQKGVNNEQKRSYFDVKHGLQTYLGYYTGLNYSIAGRLGILNPRNWVYNTAPLSTSYKNENVKNIDAKYIKTESFEIYLYGSVSPNYIFYNAFLMGQFRKSDYTLTYIEIRPLVLEWNYGIGFSIPRLGISGNVGIFGKSNET